MGGARAAALRVLFVAVAVCWLDQDLLAPNMSACAADLGLSALEKDEKLDLDHMMGGFPEGGLDGVELADPEGLSGGLDAAPTVPDEGLPGGGLF